MIWKFCVVKEKIDKIVKDKRYPNRIEIVNLVLNGMLPSEVAKSIKEDKSTIVDKNR